MRAKKTAPARLSQETVIMDGGYNENISSLELKGGELISGVNYYLLEGSGGGYQSTRGYERYDGQALASSISLDLDAEDPEADREAQRDAIDEVPGTGAVLGLHIYKNELYAFRNEVNDVYTEVYKASASGWVKQDLGSKMTFDTGATAALTVGETLTGGTSTATGTLLKVVITSGTVAGGDATGYILIDVLTGTFQSGETLTGGTSGGTINSTSLAVSQTIAKDGTYHFVNYNFYAVEDYEFMYFTNKVNKAMVFDGTAWDFIDNSGMDPNDKPEIIFAHFNRLWLSYPGGSLQYSTFEEPEDWSTNPGELGVGQDVKDLIEGVGGAMVIFLNNGIKILQGTSDSDTWQLDTFSERTGCYECTPHRMFGTIMYMNNQGVSTLEATQKFGDYMANSISQKIYKTLQEKKNLVTCATVHRELNQYRVWFSDGTGAVFSFKGPKFRGVTLLDFPDAVLVATNGRDENENTVVYFASDDTTGYVYKMESGTSFDGSNIRTRLLTSYYHYKSPLDWKKFIMCLIEMSCLSDLELDYKFYYDYSDPSMPKAQDRSYDLVAAIDNWGEKDWGVMVWSAGNLTNRIRPYIHGIAANVALGLTVVNRTAEPHTLQNMTVSFERLRRQL